MNENGEWKDFDQLLTWATWSLTESIIGGEPLKKAMHHILRVARDAKFEGKKNANP